MNIIFFGAHPDDLEILAGGTIARCAAEGHNVWMAVATNGNVGSPVLGCDEIAAIRAKEAEDAASVLGAKGVIHIGVDDEFLFDDKPTRLKFVDAVRQARADVIVTHNPNDYHPDHNACSKLASDARILSAVRLIKTEHPHLESTPELFYMDSIVGMNFVPQFYVDISETYEIKMESIRRHGSQLSWVRSIFDQDLTELAGIPAAYRGLQAGVRYAEAFVQPIYTPQKPVQLPFLESSRGFWGTKSATSSSIQKRKTTNAK